MQRSIELAILYIGTPNRYERDKFGAAGLTPMAADPVAPPRARECPIQLEATLEHVRPVAARDPRLRVPALAIEVRVRRVQVEERLLVPDDPQRIQFYGRGERL